jgi:hypothetical protein
MTRPNAFRPTLRSHWSAAAVVAAPLLLGGCSAAGDGARSTSERVSTVQGVDYADYSPSISSLQSSGYAFVCRYLSDSGNPKNISASEVVALEQGDISIVLVWEQGGEDSLNGSSYGAQQAQAALDEANALGMPSDRPIYFAIDFDPSSSQLAEIANYFDGVASVLGVSRTGAYGGYGAINYLFNEGKIAYGWQTYAWSAGQWDGRAQLRQVQNDIDNGNEDLDEAEASDYGQWGGSNGKPPPPSSCTANGVSGTCIDTSACSSMGYTSTPGLCPGANNIECCTPPADGSDGGVDSGNTGDDGGNSGDDGGTATACTANGVDGTCIDVSTCSAMAGYTSTAGLCPGANNVECCTPPPSCTVSGTAGTCIDTSLCASKQGYHSTPGYCPGANNVECCTL